MSSKRSRLCKLKLSKKPLLFLFSVGTCCLPPTDCAWADDPLSLPKARRRVTPLCSLPPANYQYQARSPSLVVRSLPALEQHSVASVEDFLNEVRMAQAQLDVLDEDLGLDPTTLQQVRKLRQQEMQAALAKAMEPKGKLLQLATQELIIAHCKVSDLALLIEPSGCWRLSLRGDQNQQPVTSSRQSLEPQLQRNAFNVQVRLLRSQRRGPELLTATTSDGGRVEQASKLAYAELKVPEFWVQREAPQFVTQMGYSPLIREHFDEIDQAEFEFFVRLDPLTGSGTGVIQP